LRILYFDCFSGAAGDMILGALIDAGVALDDVRRALGSLAITPDTIWTDRVVRAGISSTKFCVRGEELPLDHADDHDAHGKHHHHGPKEEDVPVDRADHGHEHDHGSEERHHHVHRSVAAIGRLIDTSALSVKGKTRAKELFHRLAEAEAKVHGVPMEKVHLHEVGALDSIVDIVGSVFALEVLGPDRIVSSPLNVGGGTVTSAHGRYPVPAPATIRLLEGAPIYSGPQQAELVTPTGALLVTSYANEFGPIPPMRVRRIGYGAGTRDFPDSPNVLRVLIGESDASAAVQNVVVIESEIDDMNPQIFGLLMDRLLELGALDVFYTAIQMKKNRPGTLLSVVAPPDARDRLTAAIFRETTTIGVRYREMRRECLDREVQTVHTPLGAVRFKLARRAGEMLNASPEFDDCVRLAREHGLPVKDVQAMAMKAFLDR
jgi:uncharacterized protein (TIGR00299 family) protein